MVYRFPIFSGYGITRYSDKYNLEFPTITLIARDDAGTGRIRMSSSKCFLSNHAIVIETDEYIEDYLYYHLLESDTMSLRSGSAQAQITINGITPFEIIIPPIKLCKQFINDILKLKEYILHCRKEIEYMEVLKVLLLTYLN